MFKTLLAATILAGTSTAALADVSLAINIELDDAMLNSVSYDCGSAGTVQVHYITSENNVLALVPVDDDDMVFVNTVAASGARYVAGQYEWWSTGQGGTLRNTMTDQTLLDCAAEDR